MKNFALKHPNISGLMVFLIIFAIGCGLSWLLLFWIMSSSKPQSPSDPNDGAAMAGVGILSITFTASFISAIAGGLLSTNWLKSNKKP